MMKEAQEKMDAALEHLAQEFQKLRTGRASAELIESVMVDSYGAPTPLKHLATISVPDSKSLMIQPFDPSQAPAVEKAFQESDLGLNPTLDGTVLRITLPPMTEERRKELVQVVGKKAEEARVSIRNAREAMHKQLKADDSLSEDDKKGKENELQKAVDAANEQVRDLAEQKETDVMSM
ncbi:MAG: ribosome recycling factor [Candidatus Doudnabacteria bacterium]|nr:ribosome recycling factor [Candidatus Doudnabacteria bacterium]MCA9387740.1 ribosome recycling factor [Candidatus Andersenbacteria bacterium]